MSGATFIDMKVKKSNSEYFDKNIQNQSISMS